MPSPKCHPFYLGLIVLNIDLTWIHIFQCSVNCGEGMQEREVNCGVRRRELTDPTLCVNQTRPDDTKSCQGSRCGQYEWSTNQWSPCSQSCGHGVQMRRVACINKRTGRSTRRRYCNERTKPRTHRGCNAQTCPYLWTTGEWSQVSSHLTHWPLEELNEILYTVKSLI